MMNSEARKRHATPPTPDALDATAASVLLRQRDALEDYAESLGYLNGELAARLGEARIELTAAESARDAAEGALSRVRALAEEWCISTVDGGFVGDADFAEAIHDSGAWRFARDLRAALAPVTTDETEGGA